VLVSLAPFRLPWRHNAFVAWVGLRGAVPIVLATFPQLAGIPGADILFDVVFFAVLTSVLVQGTTIPLVARWLRLDLPAERHSAPPIEMVDRVPRSSQLTELTVSPASPAVGRQILALGLPPHVLIILVGRSDEYFVPTGATHLEADDRLVVLSDSGSLETLRAAVGARPNGHPPSKAKTRA
jgi:potassium/hydrogen antiporter